jgi:isocitrate dehydrogenase (NAD+)
VNVALRKELDLYGNIRPSLSLPGVDTPFENIDLIIYRENTEDLYAGVEHMVGKHAAESIKIITREGTERICRMAFERSKEQGRKHITVVHKANIMKFTDGLFRDVFYEVSKDYENDFEEIDDRIVDNMAMQLIPSRTSTTCSSARTSTATSSRTSARASRAASASPPGRT